MRRGQSTVVGVALLVLVTVASLGALTAGIGAVVEDGATAADAARVADHLDGAVDPAVTAGRRDRVPATGGRLHATERTLRLFAGPELLVSHDTEVLVYRTDRYRLAAAGGGVIRGTGADATFQRPPNLRAGNESLFVHLVLVDADGLPATPGRDGTFVLATDADHDRRRLDPADYRIAVETATPVPWERYFERQGVPTERVDFDGDGTPSVVASYPGQRVVYLSTHDLNVVVSGG